MNKSQWYENVTRCIVCEAIVSESESAHIGMAAWFCTRKKKSGYWMCACCSGMLQPMGQCRSQKLSSDCTFQQLDWTWLSLHTFDFHACLCFFFQRNLLSGHGFCGFINLIAKPWHAKPHRLTDPDVTCRFGAKQRFSLSKIFKQLIRNVGQL